MPAGWGAGILRRGVGGASNGARLLAQQVGVACVSRGRLPA